MHGVTMKFNCAGIMSIGCNCYIFFFSSIIVLTPNGSFWVVPLSHAVRERCRIEAQSIMYEFIGDLEGR